MEIVLTKSKNGLLSTHKKKSDKRQLLTMVDVGYGNGRMMDGVWVDLIANGRKCQVVD